MADENVDQRLVRIVKALLKKTLAGQADWEATFSRSTAEQFDYSTVSATISLSSHDKGNDDLSIVMTIKNDAGVELDRLESDPWDSLGYSRILRQLYTEARRRALDIDTTINQLVNSLENGGYDDEPPF